MEKVEHNKNPQMLKNKSRRKLIKKACYTAPKLLILGSMLIDAEAGGNAGSRVPPPPPNSLSQKVW